jgi:hypothetical protein
MNESDLNKEFIIDSEGKLTDASKILDPGDAGLVKLKIDAQVFQVLKRKRRAGETIRMTLERAIMTF